MAERNLIHVLITGNAGFIGFRIAWHVLERGDSVVGADHPLQFYAAAKRANELMAHSDSHRFQLPTTGL